MSFELSTKGATVGSLVGRGIVLLILGILLAVFTFGGIIAVSIITGIFLSVFGLTLLFGCFDFEGKGGRVLSIILGILVIGIGIYAIVRPGVFMTVAAYLCGVIAFVAGIYELVIGITDKDSARNRPIQIITGIIGIAFGIFVFLCPFIGLAYAVTTLLGIFLGVYGILLLIQGIILHSKNKKAVKA